MSSLNLCQFIGNLGADPEVKTLQDGRRVVNMRLACTERWKDRDGNKQERTTWVPVIIWNEGLGKVAEQYLHKGSKCYVSGAFQVRKWQDQSGQDRYSTEIVLRQFRGELVLLGDADRAQGESSRSQESSRAAARPSDNYNDLDDDIPFLFNDLARRHEAEHGCARGDL